MMKLDWEYCQTNSDIILAEGLNSLCVSNHSENCYETGNYLILHSETPYYIGEAENIFNRLKTQFSLNSSTFYKNYLNYCKKSNQNTPATIKDFKVKFIETKIGRKEIEEFGIVNLPTILNKFQKGKREKGTVAANSDLWNSAQSKSLDILSEGEEIFLNQIPFAWYEANIPSSPGVYRVLNNDKKLIYIGESSDINIRYATHSKDTYFSALRRHIATDILGFELINKRRLTPGNNSLVNEYLRQCSIGYMKILFGRYEFEKHLIKKHSPVLNRKDAE